MVQPILRFEPWQGFPHRVTDTYDLVVLHLDGIECHLRKPLGHNTQRVEGLFEENYRSTRFGYLHPGCEFIPTRIVEIKEIRI